MLFFPPAAAIPARLFSWSSPYHPGAGKCRGLGALGRQGAFLFGGSSYGY